MVSNGHSISLLHTNKSLQSFSTLYVECEDAAVALVLKVWTSKGSFRTCQWLFFFI